MCVGVTGQYRLLYTATDAAGNVAQVHLTVDVVSSGQTDASSAQSDDPVLGTTHGITFGVGLAGGLLVAVMVGVCIARRKTAKTHALTTSAPDGPGQATEMNNLNLDMYDLPDMPRAGDDVPRDAAVLDLDLYNLPDMPHQGADATGEVAVLNLDLHESPAHLRDGLANDGTAGPLHLRSAEQPPPRPPAFALPQRRGTAAVLTGRYTETQAGSQAGPQRHGGNRKWSTAAEEGNLYQSNI